MTALWTVIVLLSVIVAVDSLAVIALARQVGLLHLRAGQRPAPLPRSRPGPHPGSSLRLDVPPGLIGSQHELILYGFVRPECGACASALAAFTEVAAGLPGNERALLVSDRDEARTRAFLAANGVSTIIRSQVMSSCRSRASILIVCRKMSWWLLQAPAIT